MKLTHYRAVALVDAPLTAAEQLGVMRLSLIPLDHALPAIQAYVARHTSGPLSPAEAQIAAEMLERCILTAAALVAFALQMGGRPSLE